MQIVSDLRQLFDAHQKRRYVKLQAYFLLAALVQVVSVASIAPFIAVLSDPGLIVSNRFLHWLYQMGDFTDQRSFLVVFAFLLMALIAVGNIVPALTGFMSWNFVRRIGTEVQADIYRGFMYGDLAQTASMNTAQMTSIVTQGVNRLIHNVVLPMSALVSSGFVILLIAMGLLVYDPAVAIVAGIVVGGGYFIIFAFSKKRLSHHGSISWGSVQSKQRLMTESLRGIKEVRLAGTEPVYEARLHQLTFRGFSSDAKVGLYSDLPRFALETMALCALLALGVFLLLRNDNWSAIVAILSVYAMAGYRLLPAAQTVFRSAATLRANTDVVREIARDVNAGREVLRLPAPPEVQFSLSGPIVLTDVSFRYPGDERNVIQSLDLQIERNAITAFVGRSGAGKSTLADLLLGLLAPTSGEITVGGTSVQLAPRSWQRSVSLVSQSVFLIDDSVEANIIFGSSKPLDRDRLERAAAMAHAIEFINELPGGFACPIGEAGGRLSGGQRQRIGIARALYNDAAVIVLDEPTSALDSFAEREVMSAIASLRGHKTIVLITHRLQSLKETDCIVLLENGALAGVGTYGEMSATCEPFRVLLESH